jgi:hypothetical protein
MHAHWWGSLELSQRFSPICHLQFIQDKERQTLTAVFFIVLRRYAMPLPNL